MKISRFLLAFTFALSALSVLTATSAHAATNATDPAGDSCAGDACGPDLTGAADRVDADGSVHLSITQASSVCNTTSYPATEVQPWFQILAGTATTQTDTGAYLGAVWAVSTTNTFQWSPQGGGADVAITSTVSAGAVEIVLPASLVSSLGGLPLTWFVTDACKELPYDPPTAYKDFAPDTGLYTVAATPTDICPNLEGAQTSVPAGAIKVGTGDCVSPPINACPDPSGGDCSPTIVELLSRIIGTAEANRLVGNLLANIINGFGGNDWLFGGPGNDTLRGGAGNDQLLGQAAIDRLFGDAGTDTARGGAGADTVTGGPGRDRLFGDAGNDTLDGRDRTGGDLINGGAGTDVCYYNPGDVVTACERKIVKT